MPAPDPITLTGAREDLALLRDAAREAGEIAMRYFGNQPQVWIKGGPSPASEADPGADCDLRANFRKATPHPCRFSARA